VADEQKVQIGEAKGRPMLHWVGKRPLDYVTAYPAQLVETFNPTGEKPETQGLLFHGNNKDVLAWLLAHGYRGKVNLIYIDPPFDSGADYVRKVQLRGVSTAKVEGEAHSLGEQIQYTDIWANDMYLQFMYERLLLLKELLADNGSIYVHMDHNQVHYIKLVCDEVFGRENFQREIIWRIGWVSGYKSQAKNWIRNHDTILFYSKNRADFTFNKEYIPYPEGYTRRDGSIPEGEGYPIEDTWNCYELDRMDSIQIMSFSGEKLDFPTQKNENLLSRIIRASSNPGDLVLDCFVGSGTTSGVAQKLGRRWIAADINKGAIQTTSKRLQTIIQEQIKARNGPEQPTIGLDDDKEEAPPPAALSFSVYRVNDYDLQVQHNEAANLAVELIGIERTKTDSFFDGNLGKRLVKIIPFTHPLTLMDLQLVKDEVEARPEEERDVVIVCLGKELAVDAWVEDYNKQRPVNRIEVIELRTDQKYGKFFVHQPAEAQVNIQRCDGKIVVDIEDFISPTIVERLEMDTPLFRAKIPDWRAMVDVVMIDTTYDGEVFDIDLSDVPKRKDDLVRGHYELDAPTGPTTVAVKIIDMLGEETLVTKEV